jgi:hypothetical protein
MKSFIREKLRNAIFENRQELFSAYHGRYRFDIDKAYSLINSNQIKYEIKRYKPFILKQLSNPNFSVTNPKYLEKIKNSLDLTKPLGIIAWFMNPETKEVEMILIDGNHRVRVAAEANVDGLLYVIRDPKDVNKFMKTNVNVSHELFPDY